MVKISWFSVLALLATASTSSAGQEDEEACRAVQGAYESVVTTSNASTGSVTFDFGFHITWTDKNHPQGDTTPTAIDGVPDFVDASVWQRLTNQIADRLIQRLVPECSSTTHEEEEEEEEDKSVVAVQSLLVDLQPDASLSAPCTSEREDEACLALPARLHFVESESGAVDSNHDALRQAVMQELTASSPLIVYLLMNNIDSGNGAKLLTWTFVPNLQEIVQDGGEEEQDVARSNHHSPACLALLFGMGCLILLGLAYFLKRRACANKEEKSVETTAIHLNWQKLLSQLPRRVRSSDVIKTGASSQVDDEDTVAQADDMSAATV